MKTKLIILSALLLIGCGSRKSTINKTDVETKKVTTDNTTTETKTDTNIKVIDCTETNEIEIIPIDNTKEIVVNGKTYKNVRLKSKKSKANIITTERKKVAEIEKKDVKTKSKSKVEVKDKEVVSEKGNFWNWIILIIIVVIVVMAYEKIVKENEL